MSNDQADAVHEIAVPNPEGLHARPVMRFVDLASKCQSAVLVTNITLAGEALDGKSAMQMMLLEATQGCVLRIEARGVDAAETVEALTALVASGFAVSDQPTTG